MNEKYPDESQDRRETSPPMGIWDRLVAEDETEFDPELVAAYVEGRLDTQQHEQVRQLLQRSPRAMDLANALYDFLEEPEEEAPGVGADVQLAAQVRETFQGDSRSPTLLLVMAASLLVAAVTGYIAVQQQRAVSGLRSEVALVTAKMRVGQFSDALLPESNPVTAFEALDPQHEPERIRGAEDPPDDSEVREAKLREAELRKALEAIDAVIRQQGETAERLNLRAAAALGIAPFAPTSGDLHSEADRADANKAVYWRDQAERSLRRALELDAEFAPAWFNLALVLEKTHRADEARQAWKAYLEYETREDLKQAVRKRLGIDP
jgi:tetratricopeptide (TPR) repeat protein